jgi:hypothetical protein
MWKRQFMSPLTQLFARGDRGACIRLEICKSYIMDSHHKQNKSFLFLNKNPAWNMKKKKNLKWCHKFLNCKSYVNYICFHIVLKFRFWMLSYRLDITFDSNPGIKSWTYSSWQFLQLSSVIRDE